MIKFFSMIILFFFLSFLNKMFYMSMSYSYFMNNMFINLMSMNLSMSYMFLWFMFFMYLMMYLIMFLLSSSMYSYMKFNYMWFMMIMMTNSVSLLSLMDDFATFMMIFESLFFPMCFMSLFFSFSNSFIFAMFCLILFSSLSSMLCMTIFFMLMSHMGMIDMNIFIEFCFLDSPYLNITILTLLMMLFFMKYPVWPLHIWLPEVHVEVTTEMSMMLAAVVLKMGFFGLYKFVVITLIQFCNWWLGIMDMFMLIGMFFLTMNMLFLCDYKKLMAHWSILHTGISLMLVWHQDLMFTGLVMLCNLAHIMSSSFMFYLVGYMYDNHGLRVFLLLMTFFGYSIWGSFFMGLVLFNIDFPFMLLFFMELIMCVGFAMFSSLYLMLFGLVSMIMFCTSMYMYVTLNFFSFVWMNKNIKIDLTMNDVIIMYLMSFIILKLFYFFLLLL